MILDLNQEQIKEYLSKQILDILLGNEFKKKLENLMTDCMYGYNSPVMALFKEELKKQFNSLFALQENQDKFKITAAKFLSQDFLDKIIEKSIRKIMEEVS